MCTASSTSPRARSCRQRSEGALRTNAGVGRLATRARWWRKILAMSHHQVSARSCLEEAPTDDAPRRGGSAVTPGAAGQPRPTLRLLTSPPPRDSPRKAYPRLLDPSTLSDHIDALYRAARALCGSRHDAEDLVQETFAQVLKRPRLIRDGNEIAYLMRAMRNTYANRYRTASRRPATREALRARRAVCPRPWHQPRPQIVGRGDLAQFAGVQMPRSRWTFSACRIGRLRDHSARARRRSRRAFTADGGASRALAGEPTGPHAA